MISKIIQRECYIPDSQITDEKYNNLYIENIFNNDFDYPGPCIDDFPIRNCPNTRVIAYEKTDISNKNKVQKNVDPNLRYKNNSNFFVNLI